MIVEKEVSVSGASFKLCGYDSDPYFRDINVHLEHGFLVPVLAYCLSPNASMIDVGANLGGTMSLMHKFVEKPSIVCVEPSATFACLQATIAANGFENTRCVNACAGKADGMVSFADCGDYAGQSAASASHSHIVANDASNRRVPVKMLDTMVREMAIDKVDFVKIDVEGFEEDVLDGMTMVIERHRPMIYMEFNAFCLSVHARRSPYSLLVRIRDSFGGFIATRGGHPVFFSSDEDLTGFFLTHMREEGCVEDILFSSGTDLRALFAL